MMKSTWRCPCCRNRKSSRVKVDDAQDEARARAEGKLGRTQGTHARRRVEGRGWRALREPTQTFDAVGHPVVSCVCESWSTFLCRGGEGANCRRIGRIDWRVVGNSSGRFKRVLRAQYVQDALDSFLIGRPAIVWWLRKLELREKKRGPR